MLLAGCSGSQLRFAPPDYVRSATAANVTRDALLYVSDSGANEVHVYSYPRGNVVATLTGFDAPEGECVDGAGDVWIRTEADSKIIAYAHGGNRPIATLSDAREYPDGCSVDPTTGNLAVTNAYSTSAGGSIAIYAHAKGKPKVYADPGLSEYSYLSYDANGNLFVDGESSHHDFALVELPKGSSKFTSINLSRVKYPGAVAWDGSHIVVGDADPLTNGLLIYRISNARVVGKIRLKDACAAVGDFFISRGDLVGLDAVCLRAEIFNYPAGGSPIEGVKLARLGAPVGIVVSRARR
jgi:DNA-binding beta-propeller fold protein YncE